MTCSCGSDTDIELKLGKVRKQGGSIFNFYFDGKLQEKIARQRQT